MVICFKKLKISSKYRIGIFCSIFLIFVFLQNGCSQSPLLSIGDNKLSNKINSLIDINGDGKSDFIVWNFSNLFGDKNKLPKSCFFEAISPQNINYQISQVGEVGNIPIYGDFNGDGNSDYGVYKFLRDGNEWYLIDGLSMVGFGHRFGESGDLPVPSDYDGDKKCDFVIYRPRNSGFYGYLSNGNKLLEIHLGITGDIPVPMDYDGDGWADLSSYRQIGGIWIVRSSKDGLTRDFNLGGSDYLPIPSDYDGDGKADLAVWNYRNNNCKINFSKFSKKLSEKLCSEVEARLKGIKCFPVSSDYNGDGKSEITFWENENKLLHVFNIVGNDINYENYKVSISSNSLPVEYYLLRKFLLRNPLSGSLEYLKSFVTSSLANKSDNLKCDFDGDFVNDSFTLGADRKSLKVLLSSTMTEAFLNNDFGGEPLIADFDGDGKCDFGGIDFSSMILNYFSSNLGLPVNNILDNRIEGIPLAGDLDLDFMADLIFYNPETEVCGVLQSSDQYAYKEVFLGSKIVSNDKPGKS